MLFKLSLKNIKKSIKDYSIYFFTLVFAVAMFYMFNSLDAQSTMLVLNKSKYEIIHVLIEALNYVSIFVSIVLGFLIVYSNKFLIKRRKKEIGLYLTLGMSKRKVSFILVLETLLIGLVSLGIGLLLGIGLSQFVSILTAKLFEVNMTSLKFVFSINAFRKTIRYFGIIFILIMIFNVISLSKYKLIDLLYASRRNEKVKIRNKYVTIISFVLSIILIGYAYYLLFNNVLLMMDYKTIVMIASGALGTFLLFFSLSGFILKAVQRIKKIYYKDLNIFTLNQVNSKINTTVISTTIICLMLLLTIGILSSSLSLSNVLNKDIAQNNLTDFTINTYPFYTTSENGIEVANNDAVRKLEKMTNNKDLNNYVKEYVLLHKYYDPKLVVKDMLTNKAIKNLQKEYGTSLSFDFNVPIIKKSEYEKLSKIQNQKIIDINTGEYLLLTNIEFISKAYQDYYESKKGITINNIQLKPATDKIINVAIENYNTSGNDGVIVVSDEVVKNLDLLQLNLIGNYVKNDDAEAMDEKLEQFIVKQTDLRFDIRSKVLMESASIGTSAMVTFVGLYLGITFAISSATVIAIGQLSESSDNKNRYKILKQIGADNKMINKALFIQILIVFIFPLAVALIHSYVGLKEINSLIITFGDIDLTSNIILTTLFMIVVYGGYFILTYLCSKNIIKE